MQPETETTQSVNYNPYLGSYTERLDMLKQAENLAERFSLLKTIGFTLGVDPATMPSPDEIALVASRLTHDERRQARSNLFAFERDVWELREDFKAVFDYKDAPRLSSARYDISDGPEGVQETYTLINETILASFYLFTMLDPEKSLEDWRGIEAFARVVTGNEGGGEKPSPLNERVEELAAYARRALNQLSEQAADEQDEDDSTNRDVGGDIDLESIGKALGHRAPATRRYLSATEDSLISENRTREEASEQ